MPSTRRRLRSSSKGLLRALASTLAALLLPALGSSVAAAKPKAPAAPTKIIGLVVLPGKGADTATAREVRLKLLETFRTERELALVDTARRVSAQPTRLEPATKRRLQEGIFALEQRKAGRAIKLLQRVQRDLHKDLAGSPKSALADAALHIAAAQLVARRRRQALRTLVALLTWRPTSQLALKTTAPRGWDRTLERAKAIVGMLPTGALRISSVPSRAATYVDGKRTGPTPAVVSNLVVGAHYVTVRLAGYKKAVLEVRVRKSGEQNIAVTLRERGEAKELLSMLREMRDEMGRSSVLFPDALRADLGLRRVLVVIVDRQGKKLSLAGYLYVLDGGKLRGKTRVKTDLPPRTEQLMPLALWRTTSLVGKKPPKARSGKPFYKQWWFWAAVGVAGAAGVVIPLVATAGTDAGRTDRFRVSW